MNEEGKRGGNKLVLMLVRLSRATGLAASFKIPQTITFSQDVKEADAG